MTAFSFAANIATALIAVVILSSEGATTTVRSDFSPTLAAQRLSPAVRIVADECALFTDRNYRACLRPSWIVEHATCAFRFGRGQTVPRFRPRP